MKRNDNALRSAADRGTKSTVLGIGVNLGLGLAKCSAGFLGNSFALVADGVESVTDVLSGFVVYFGLKIARKPADADHPYGHGKAEPIAAVVDNNIGIDVIGFERTAPNPEVDRARDGVVSENLVFNITSRGNPAYGNEANSDGIRNNLIYSCHTAGISIGGYDLKRGKTEDTTIVNNTLYNNDALETGTGEILMQFYLRNNVFKNNIIYVGKHGRVMSSRSGRMDGSPTVIFDHNLYYYPGGSKGAKWSYDRLEFASFEEYVQASGNDQHSRFGDPEFVDAASSNFHLRTGSPARNGGENPGPQIVGDEDLDGRHRLEGAKIDIGCYETSF